MSHFLNNLIICTLAVVLLTIFTPSNSFVTNRLVTNNLKNTLRLNQLSPEAISSLDEIKKRVKDNEQSMGKRP
jgi:hypothetical protein